MKLTKRMGLIYFVALLISIIICFAFLIGFRDGAHNGEQIRVVEIAEGVQSSLDRYVERQEEFTQLISNTVVGFLDKSDNNANIHSYLEEFHEFDSSLVYNSENQNYIEFKEDSNISPALIQSAFNALDLNSPTTTSLVADNNIVYIVSIVKIPSKDFNYFISVKTIDQEVCDYISSSTNSKSNLYFADELTNETLYEAAVYDKNYFFREDNNIITTFLPLDVTGINEPLYLQVSKIKTVIETVTSNFLKFTILLVLFLILTNITLYLLISKTVIRRIVNLHSDLDSINDNKFNNRELKNNKYKDEITDLAKSISKMHSNLTEANVELKSFSEDMTKLATLDSLTDLYNRRTLHEYTQRLCRTNHPFLLFFIDLDNFKKLNDTVGHEYGDSVLVSVSKDLRNLATEGLKVGRLGGDEFVVVKEGSLNKEEIEDCANLILQSISNEYIVNGFKYTVECSIGVSTFPLHTTDHTNIYKYADIAMYEAKKSPGLSYKIFNKDMNTALELELKLKAALENNEMVTYFQPIYNLSKECFDTAEALVRWHSKDRIIYPDEFLPVAKQSGLISYIDKRVFMDACALCKEFKVKYGIDLTVSINISATMLLEDTLSETLISTVNSYDIPFNLIQLEITEDEIIKEFDYAKDILNHLKAKGFKIALDDFGVGYSSFDYIKKLPLDVIKLDKSLISTIQYDKKALSIVLSIIELCKSLNLEIICEGVELEGQIEVLSKAGCNKLQGYFFSKPIEKHMLTLLKFKKLP